MDLSIIVLGILMHVWSSLPEKFQNIECMNIPYGRFHPGRELTAIELENFWFALKPINMGIYFKNSCPFVCVNFFSSAVLVYFVYQFHLLNLSQMASKLGYK